MVLKASNQTIRIENEAVNAYINLIIAFACRFKGVTLSLPHF